MKNINKSNIMGLIGMDVINIKNEAVGTVVGDFNGKYIVNVDGEEKFYSESTLIRNWKIVEEETEETSEAVLTTEESSNEEIIAEEIEDEIVKETEEEVINENDEVIEEETEEASNEESVTEEIEDEDEIVEETEEEVINENNEVIEEETEDKNDEAIEEGTEEFILETENRGIIDNIKETEGKVKITGHLYNVPVKFDKINQTTVWKTLNRLYDNRKNENDEYSLEDKKYLVRQLKQLDERVFAGAFRCLVSKTKQNYIEELMK